MSEPKYTFDLCTAADLLARKDIYIPKFQRGLCWTYKQQKDYLASCAAGDIPGTPILCTDQNTQKPYLIDFQQRYHTFAAYQANPGKYYPSYLSWADQIYLIVSPLVDASVRANIDVNKTIEKIIEEHFAEGVGADKKRYVREALEDRLSVRLSRDASDKIDDIVAQIHASIAAYLDLNDVNLSIIDFHGTPEDAARNFEKINSTGKGLNRYDIWHARWDCCRIVLADTEYNNRILKTVVGYYTGLKASRDERLKSDFSADEVLDTREIDLYDLSIGLGSGLSSFASAMCTGGNATRRNMELGCGVMGIVTRENVDDAGFADAVARNLRAFQDEKFSADLIAAIFDTARVMQNIFARWLIVPGTSKTHTYNSVGISNAFILAAFASLFHTRYAVNWTIPSVSVKTDASSQAAHSAIQTNLPAWLICETVKKSFLGGAGTSYLKSFYLPDEDGIIANETKYAEPVEKSELLGDLLRWNKQSYKDNLAKKPDVIAEMLLIFYTNTDNSVYKAERYDVEHIFDKKKSKANTDCAPHVLGNLMYLSRFTNRSKKDSSLWDLIGKHDGLVLNEDYLNQIMYPDSKTYAAAVPKSNHNRYDAVTRARGEKMIEEIVAAVC